MQQVLFQVLVTYSKEQLVHELGFDLREKMLIILEGNTIMISESKKINRKNNYKKTC